MPKITPTEAFAWVALFVALGGSAYAAGKIDGRTIAKSSIPANRLKKDSLTGAQVSEAKLATVPRAVRADEADRAVDASRATEADRAAVAESAGRVETAARALRVRRVETADRSDFATAVENAERLRGASPGFYQRSCGPGAVRGYVTFLPGNPPSPVVGEFNCARGQKVDVRELELGRFQVAFTGQVGGGFAIARAEGVEVGATIPKQNFTAASVAPVSESPPTFNVTIFDTKTNERQNREFSIVLF